MGGGGRHPRPGRGTWTTHERECAEHRKKNCAPARSASRPSMQRSRAAPVRMIASHAQDRHQAPPASFSSTPKSPAQTVPRAPAKRPSPARESQIKASLRSTIPRAAAAPPKPPPAISDALLCAFTNPITPARDRERTEDVIVDASRFNHACKSPSTVLPVARQSFHAGPRGGSIYFSVATDTPVQSAGGGILLKSTGSGPSRIALGGSAICVSRIAAAPANARAE